MSALHDLHAPKGFRRMRESSYNRSGANRDNVVIGGNDTFEVPVLEGPGVIRHVWMTLKMGREWTYRNVAMVIRFDGAAEPQVDASLADFFCFGHGLLTDVNSLPIQVSRQPHLTTPPYFGSLNSFFPMPFGESATVSFRNETADDVTLYYYVDWERHDQAGDGGPHFHTTVTEAKAERPRGQRRLDHGEFDAAMENRRWKDNFCFLNAERYAGHYVGVVLNVECRPEDEGKWWEGDDMFVIDGEPWPPRLHGTGTEDYFNLAWGFRQVDCRPEYGVTWIDRPSWARDQIDGRFTMYRFHVSDPVPFERSLHASLEHGHANDCTARYRSTAYWYGRKL